MRGVTTLRLRPEDPADTEVAMDPDEHLPWPLVSGLHEWWREAQSEFHADTRYLSGQPITDEWLWHVLRTGRQRTRAAGFDHHLVKPLDLEALEQLLAQPA